MIARTPAAVVAFAIWATACGADRESSSPPEAARPAMSSPAAPASTAPHTATGTGAVPATAFARASAAVASPVAAPFGIRLERVAEGDAAIATVQGMGRGEAFEIIVEGSGGGTPLPATADAGGVYRLRIPIGPSATLKVVARRSSGETARAELVLAMATATSGTAPVAVATPTPASATVPSMPSPAALAPVTTAPATAPPRGPLVTNTPLPTVRVRGTVSDVSGAGVADILVEANVDIGESYDIALSATTAADGMYELVGMPGRYAIVFNAARSRGLAKQYWRGASHPARASTLDVRADQTSIDARLEHTYALAGQASGLDGRVVNACVHAMAFTPAAPADFASYRALKVASAQIRLDGRFVIAGVPPGTYRIAFSLGGPFGGFDVTRDVWWWGSGSYDFAGARSVTVTTADVGAIGITLPLAGHDGTDRRCDFY